MYAIRRSDASSESQQTSRWNQLIVGGALVLASFLWFMAMMFNLIGSKLLPPTGNPVVDFWRKDWYYCLLLPLCIPVVLVAVDLNWLAMKFFRHN